MANNIRLTRIELINTKKRVKVASRGLELLKMKRQSLVMEFFKISNEIKGLKENIKNDIENGLNAIRMAEIIDGTLEIERISYMFSSPEIKIGGKNIIIVSFESLLRILVTLSYSDAGIHPSIAKAFSDDAILLSISSSFTYISSCSVICAMIS